MTICFVRGVSVFGPGLNLWTHAREILRGANPFVFDTTPPSPPSMLAPNERRRSGLPTRLALTVCKEAVAMAGLSPNEVGAVFASANGEGAIIHTLLETLAEPDPLLSPTQFHNSVHNAVAGYWSIATASEQPVTCLGCHDWIFASALLKAAAETCAERRDTLLCLYDAALPEPLHACRRTEFPFAAAFVLSPEPGLSHLAQLSLTYRAEPAADADNLPRHPGLRALVAGNAAAQALGLLESLALGRPAHFAAALLDGSVQIELAP